MRIASNGKYSIYVYVEVGQPHHLPHCHVRWVEGETLIELPSLKVLAGMPLPREAKQLVFQNLEEICTQWENLNIEE